MKKKHYICKLEILKKERYFVKWIDEWKDELIVFLDKNGEVKIFSSICPHFGGEIYFCKNKKKLRCKWHDWIYCPKTGKCETYNIKTNVRNYQVSTYPKELKNYDFFIENNKLYLKNDLT